MWQTPSSERPRCSQACDRIHGSFDRARECGEGSLAGISSPPQRSDSLSQMSRYRVAWRYGRVGAQSMGMLVPIWSEDFKPCRTVLALQRSDCHVACLAAALVSDRFGPRRNAKLLPAWRTNHEPSHGSCASPATVRFSRPPPTEDRVGDVAPPRPLWTRLHLGLTPAWGRHLRFNPAEEPRCWNGVRCPASSPARLA